ncbi:MAG: ATP-binding protein [Actinomycetota bacterium]|nr:MAG: ATP-binding protein [Actinomycetota bacterium]
MTAYLPRVADGELERRLRAIGAVVIEGPKACGKTWTASQFATTTFRLDEDPAIRALIRNAPEQLFESPTPILFDEWQVEPTLWNRVRRQVDDRQGKGLYILTGSATPNDDATRHSGAGRFGVIRMRPMSLFESKHSNGDVSLAALLEGESQQGNGQHLSFIDAVERIVIGGWPELLNSEEDEARNWLRDYLRQVAEIDVQGLGTRRNPGNIRRLLASLGRAVGQSTKSTEIAKDVGGDDGPIARDTLANYLNALERLHIIDDSEPWRPHMRSRARLRQAPVRYLVDPSLGLAALDIGSTELMRDLNALGLQFEALVVRDLRVYAQPLGGTVDSWRDSNGHEVDAIVNVRDDKWGAFEIKLDHDAVDEAAGSLLRFATKVDTSRHGEPAFLGVIISSGSYAYRRNDGVHVIPIGCLGP